MMSVDPDRANPGSDEARQQGCTCPVMDNNRGKYLPWTGAWWMNEDCPYHFPPP